MSGKGQKSSSPVGMLWTLWRAVHRDQSGQSLLLLVLILMMLGELMVGAALTFADNSITLARKGQETHHALFAADAGVQAIVRDLTKGLDPLRPGYALPSVNLNDFSITIVVAHPSNPIAPPPGEFCFLDPGLPQLSPQQRFTFQLVVGDKDGLLVNWPFTPSSQGWEIFLHRGDASGPIVADLGGVGSPGTLSAPEGSDLLTGGPYTLEFFNDADRAKNSAPYSSTGDTSATWVRVHCFKDYRITATAGGVKAEAYVRQVPGPSFPTNPQNVAILVYRGLELVSR